MGKIGLIYAMEAELESLLERSGAEKLETVAGVPFYAVAPGIVACAGGIGKVNIAMATQLLLTHYAPDLVLNAGVAGAMENLPVGTLVLAEQFVQHDMDTSAVGDPVGLISGINIIRIPADEALTARLRACVERLGHRCVVGTIASGDQFVASKEKKDDIRAKFDGAIAAEMEGGSIGQVCYINHVPFAVLRTISDGDGGGMDYQQFVVKAAETSIAAVIDFIRSYN